MDFGLTDEQELLLDSLRELLERECPESSIAELDRTHQAPTSFRRAAVLLREAKGREPCLVQRTPERRGCLVGPVELSDGGLGALALEELPKAVEQQLLLVRQAEVHGPRLSSRPLRMSCSGPRPTPNLMVKTDCAPMCPGPFPAPGSSSGRRPSATVASGGRVIRPASRPGSWQPARGRRHPAPPHSTQPAVDTRPKQVCPGRRSAILRSSTCAMGDHPRPT